MGSRLFDDLDDVFVVEDVVLTNDLRVVLGRRTPNKSVLEFFDEAFVERVAHVGDRGVASDDDWGLVVWDLALRLCVNTNQIEVLPDLLHELVEVPRVLGRDGDVVRALADDVKFFD